MWSEAFVAAALVIAAPNPAGTTGSAVGGNVGQQGAGDGVAGEQREGGGQGGGAREAMALGFDVQPDSIRASSYIHFDEDGGVRSESHNFSLSLNVSYGPDVTPVAYRDMKLTRIVTDTGRELNAPDQDERDNISRHGHGGNQRRFQVGVELAPPPLNASAFAEIKGRLTVICAGGDRKRATLAPFKRIEGRRVRVEGLNQRVALTVTREQDGERLKITYPRKAAERIAGFKLTDADGDELGSRVSGYGRSGDTSYRYFQTQMPDDGRVEVTFFTKMFEVDVPFTLKNVPLPRPDRTEDAELVVQAVAPEDAAEPGEDQPEPLDVVVE